MPRDLTACGASCEANEKFSMPMCSPEVRYRPYENKNATFRPKERLTQVLCAVGLLYESCRCRPTLWLVYCSIENVPKLCPDCLLDKLQGNVRAVCLVMSSRQ